LNNYRVDIQALRGIAILLVITFHFFPNYLPLGYLGVDLFFFISGFLITGTITKNYNNKNFLFLHFYAKRFRRLAPSLLFVILIFSLTSFFILLPIDQKNFWYSVISSLFLVPNFFFWSQGGYFGSENSIKTFLHFWSLGVEFQFYLIFPFLLIFLLKFFKKSIILVITVLIFFSIFLNIYLFKIDGQNLAFFMLPNRLWEFLLGGLIVFLPKKKINNFLNLILNIFIFITFIFIIFFSFKFNIIFYIRDFLLLASVTSIIYLGTQNPNYIRSDVLQFFGKISYSLYLLHWPILVLVKYFLIREINIYETLFVLFISIMLSYLMYLYVENYFYKISSDNFYKKFIKYIFVAIIFLSLIFFINFFYLKTYPKKIFDISQSIGTNYRCSVSEYNFFKIIKSCNLNKNSFIKKNDDKFYPVVSLFGNSHAQMYGYALKEAVNILPINGRIIALNSCLPTISVNISTNCILKAKKNLNYLLNQDDIKIILIGLNWNFNNLFDEFGNEIINNKNNMVLPESVYDLAIKIKNANKKVAIIMPIEEPEFQISSVLARKLYFNRNIDVKTFHSKAEFEKKYKHVIDYFISKKDLNIILPHEIQCSDKFSCNFIINENGIFSDSGHLSQYGSLLMTNIFIKEIKKFLYQ
jgi:peptidoglycan/LPS O-acetylase OafA/YrhL